MATTGIKTIAQNKKAYHDYTVLESFEAGISLCGTEVKSIRARKINLKDCFCVVEKGELIVYNMHISPYEQGNIFNRDPMRPKKLLMHRKEINRLLGYIKQDGLTLIPLSVYLKGRYVKVQLAVCKGKKQYDKRDSSARKSAAREIDRAMKERSHSV